MLTDIYVQLSNILYGEWKRISTEKRSSAPIGLGLNLRKCSLSLTPVNIKFKYSDGFAAPVAIEIQPVNED